MNDIPVAAVPRLVVRGRTLDLAAPVLMGIVNATPDSFSDAGERPTTDERIALAVEQAEAGAAVIDVGGQSGRTGVPEVSVDEEIARVVPVVSGIRTALPGTLLSVDTYRPAVVAAVLDAGADVVNDVSGLAELEVARLCAAAGAGLVVMHTRVRPKLKLLDPGLYGTTAEDVVDDVVAFLGERLDAAAAVGLPAEATIVDPGPDYAKTPRQTVDVLRHLDRVRGLGRPLLLALSRKDFIGAVTGRSPRRRLGGTLAAVGQLGGPGTILRVHDVDVVADYLAVAAVLAGRAEVHGDLTLRRDLRHEPPAGAGGPMRG
ncbi:MAG TPA: dihydropteroate synthase [Acidimicrobiales bacterium]|nr:dihydropteroate synthase [Acidimicrobiales bacterium]